MKLADLDPSFQRIVEPGKRYQTVETLAEAQGVQFLCPKCVQPGGVGHYVLCWFRGVGPSEVPGPGRWNATGDHPANLTLRPSVHLSGPGCGWHGFVTNGEVSILPG